MLEKLLLLILLDSEIVEIRFKAELNVLECRIIPLKFTRKMITLVSSQHLLSSNVPWSNI